MWAVGIFEAAQQPEINDIAIKQMASKSSNIPKETTGFGNWPATPLEQWFAQIRTAFDPICQVLKQVPTTKAGGSGGSHADHNQDRSPRQQKHVRKSDATKETMF